MGGDGLTAEEMDLLSPAAVTSAVWVRSINEYSVRGEVAISRFG